MKISFDLIVVIPVGPEVTIEMATDTVSSIQHYIRSSCKLIFVDDSQRGTGAKLSQLYPDADILTTVKLMGKLGGMYVSLADAFRYAVDTYNFKALLRMDTDVLIIGKNPEIEAIKLFAGNAKVGLAGQYPLDYYGKPWDISWPASRMYMMTRYKLLLKPVKHLTFLYYYLKAKRNGYERGESVFGGVCFYSEALVLALRENNLLPNKTLARVRLEEDHLFSVLCKALGFDFASLSGKGQPMGCAWRGLPASPAQLLADGKKIIHSTRFWQDMDETAIRNYFRKQRESEAGIMVESGR